MHRLAGLLIGALMLLRAGDAWADVVPQAGDGELCQQAVSISEQTHHIPERLLDAISRVESGRYDPQSNAVKAWPWTINAEGQGYFYPTKAEAVAAARNFLNRGITSIDVGCMQINLHHHPEAFTTLDQAFDPRENARYAGDFLKDLFAQTGNWPQATGDYHSLTPPLGFDYQRKVMAVWHGSGAHDLYSSHPFDDGSGQSGLRPYPFNRPFPIDRFGGPPRVRMINSTAATNLAHSYTGRTLASYRDRPVRLAMRRPMPTGSLFR